LANPAIISPAVFFLMQAGASIKGKPHLGFVGACIGKEHTDAFLSAVHSF